MRVTVKAETEDDLSVNDLRKLGLQVCSFDNCRFYCEEEFDFVSQAQEFIREKAEKHYPNKRERKKHSGKNWLSIGKVKLTIRRNGKKY